MEARATVTLDEPSPQVPEGSPCCELHSGGGALISVGGTIGLVGECCDPEDCGPCCPNCPTCPTINWRGVL